MVGMIGALGMGAIGGASVNIVISAVNNFSKTIGLAQTQLSGLTKVARISGMALTGMGIVGAVAMGGMVKQAMDFESAFIGVRKTVELSEAEFRQLEDRFKSMSSTIPVAFEELAAIGEIAGQLGVEGVDNLEKFTRTIADIAATTNLTAEEAATNFARLANIMQEPLDNIDRMGSVVVELGNNFATTEGEILEFATRIAASGKGAGMTSADLFALGTAFSAVGIQAERGGTAVSKTMDKMVEAVAFGGDKLGVFAETAGLTAEEFQKLFKADASKAFELFVLGMGKAGDDVFKIFDELELKDQRLMQSFRALAGAGGLITETLETSDEEWKTNTALTIEAEKRYKSMASQMKILTNKITIIAAEFGKVLFPVLEKIIDRVSDLVGWFSDLDDGTKNLIVKIGLAATAFALIAGPLLLLIGFVPQIVTGFGAIGTAMKLLTGKAGGLTASLNLIPKFIGIAFLYQGLKDFQAGKITAAIGDVLVAAGLFTLGTPAGKILFGVGIVLKLMGDEEFLVDVLKVMAKVGAMAAKMGKLIIKNMFGIPINVEELEFIASIGDASKKASEQLKIEDPATFGQPQYPTANLADYNTELDLLIQRYNEGKIPENEARERIENLGTKYEGAIGWIKKYEDANTLWEETTLKNIKDVNLGLDSLNRTVTTTHEIKTVQIGGIGGLGGVFGGFGIGSLKLPFFQTGGVMPHTGLAYLHKGETVTPAGKGGGITINIGEVSGFSPQDISRALVQELGAKVTL